MLPRSVFSEKRMGVSRDGDTIEIMESSDSEDSVCLDDDRSFENNDQRSPEKKVIDKSYQYSALSKLNPNLDWIPDEVESIVILLYKVNLDGKVPFLEFGMDAYNDSKVCFFMRIGKNDVKNMSLKNSSKGFFLDNSSSTAFVFVEIDNNQRKSVEMLSLFMPKMRYLVSDEIMNLKTTYDYIVDDEVAEFFASERDFLFLQNQQGELFETPCVGYAAVEKSNADFVRAFGVDRMDTTAYFGTGFYFTNYQKAKENKEKVSGNNQMFVSRFVLFLGKMKVLLNHPEDPSDESDTKTCLLNKIETRKHARLTMRITDHNGLWKNFYDSIYVGNVVLDDDSVFEPGPIFAIKDHNQQLGLDYRL